MPFVVDPKICNQCPESKRDILGIYIGILRCGICHCFVSAKSAVGGKCPKFDKPEEVEQYRLSKELMRTSLRANNPSL